MHPRAMVTSFGYEIEQKMSNCTFVSVWGIMRKVAVISRMKRVAMVMAIQRLRL